MATCSRSATRTTCRPFFSGTIADGSVVKTGTGTLTLSAADTYSGGTTISQSTLQSGSTMPWARGRSRSTTLTPGTTLPPSRHRLCKRPSDSEQHHRGRPGHGNEHAGHNGLYRFEPHRVHRKSDPERGSNVQGELEGTNWDDAITSTGSVIVQVDWLAEPAQRRHSAALAHSRASPASSEPGPLRQPLPGCPPGSYNLTGIVNDGTTFSGGGMDGAGNDLSANLLGPQVTWDDQNFTLADRFPRRRIRCRPDHSAATGNFNQLLLLADGSTAAKSARPSRSITPTGPRAHSARTSATGPFRRATRVSQSP